MINSMRLELLNNMHHGSLYSRHVKGAYMNLTHPFIAHRTLILVLSLLFVVVAAFAAPASAASSPIDLNGTWSAGNLGTFFIRQIGNEVWWFGEDDPLTPTWSNIAHGFIEGKIVKLKWIDVPKGTSQLQGTVEFEIKYPDRIVRTAETGGFGVKVLERAKRGVEEE
jgi:hypothetical protein